MKQKLRYVILLLLASLASIHLSIAQDIVYFSDGDTPIENGTLKDLIRGKLVIIKTEDGKQSEYKFSLSSILMVFSKNGNFLVISELSADTLQAKQQIKNFLTETPPKTVNHFLIKASPFTVIPATEIPVDNDDIVNYKNKEGNSASISKGELAAILYRDGHHWVKTKLLGLGQVLLQARPLLTDVQKPATNENDQKKPAAIIAPVKPTDEQLPTVSNLTRILSEEEKEEYRKQSLQRIEDLLVYINIIADRTSGDEEKKDRAIRQALKLFMPGATVDVNSAKRPGIRTITLQQYLTRLKLLPYASVKVEWLETVFVKDLTQEADGFYYGTIEGKQIFTAQGANGQVVYQDETDKNVRVKVEGYEKVIDGQTINKYKIMLGNIRIKAD